MPRQRWRNGQGGRYTEYVSFSLVAATTTNIQVANLAQRPGRSNFRPTVASVTTTSFVPATATLPGFYAPVAIQIDFFSPQDEIVATSPTTVVRPNGTTVHLRYPSSSDWWPYNNTTSDVVLRISAVCLGASGPSATVRPVLQGVVTIKIRTGPEIAAAACPTSHVGLPIPTFPENIDTEEEVD